MSIKNKIFSLIFALGTMLVLSFFQASLDAQAASETALTKNKKIVTEFYDLAFNRHQIKLAAERYLSEAYIQHNPHVASGRKAFIDAFANGPNDDPSRTEFKRTIAEGDLVVLHSRKIPGPGQRERVGVDIFRIKGNRIDEHWDVNQDIPDKTENGNTVY